MEYSIVQQSALEQMRMSEDLRLTHADLIALTANRKTVEKFILQKAFSIQTELGMGRFRGKEEEAYGAVRELNALAQDLMAVEMRFAELESKLAEDVLKRQKTE